MLRDKQVGRHTGEAPVPHVHGRTGVVELFRQGGQGPGISAKLFFTSQDSGLEAHWKVRGEWSIKYVALTAVARA